MLRRIRHKAESQTKNSRVRSKSVSNQVIERPGKRIGAWRARQKYSRERPHRGITRSRSQPPAAWLYVLVESAPAKRTARQNTSGTGTRSRFPRKMRVGKRS